MKYLSIILILLFCFQLFASNDKDSKTKSNKAVEDAYYQKENAILQLNSSKDFNKVVKRLEVIDDNISVSGKQFDQILEKYGSDCELACLDINQFVISITENESDYNYVIDKSKLQCAIKYQIKCDKCVKHDKCKCLRILKRNCKHED